MSRGIFRAIYAFSLLFAFPALTAAADIGETFPSSTWTISGTVAVEGSTVEPRSQRAWRVRFDQPVTPPSLRTPSEISTQEPAAQARPQAYEYSDAYNTRRRIHMIASYATIPLFVGQYLSGDKLFDQPGGEGRDSTAKSAHGPLAAGIAALFAVNSVTGVWNLMEARHDPNGRTRRLIHGILMLGADAGFVATGMMAPDDDEIGSSDRSAHRNVAITSMGVAAASYVYMLVTR